jgi:hypothetical protein
VSSDSSWIAELIAMSYAEEAGIQASLPSATPSPRSARLSGGRTSSGSVWTSSGRVASASAACFCAGDRLSSRWISSARRSSSARTSALRRLGRSAAISGCCSSGPPSSSGTRSLEIPWNRNVTSSRRFPLRSTCWRAGLAVPTEPARLGFALPNAPRPFGYWNRARSHAARAIFRNSSATASLSARCSASRRSKAADSSA